MAESLQDKIEAVSRNFARKLVQDLTASMNEALDFPKANGQNSHLTFDSDVLVTDNSANIKIIASDTYWINIEDGRGKNKKAPPSDSLGKEWQLSHNIDARKILKEIQINYQTKNGLSKVKKGLSKQSKGLSFDKAAKQLSFIFARSIGKKGIPAKPFVDRVLYDGRVKEFSQLIANLIGAEIRTNIGFKGTTEVLKLEV